jgi:predicted methyltransferase
MYNIILEYIFHFNIRNIFPNKHKNKFSIYITSIPFQIKNKKILENTLTIYYAGNEYQWLK